MTSGLKVTEVRAVKPDDVYQPSRPINYYSRLTRGTASALL